MESRLTFLAPDPRLRGVVRRYADFSQRADGPVQTRETPIAGMVVLIDLDTGWSIEGKRFGSFAMRAARVRCRSTSCRWAPARCSACRPASCAGSRSRSRTCWAPTPTACRNVFTRPAAWRPKARVLDAALVRRLAHVSGGAAAAVPPDVVRAWNLLKRTGGRLPVEALATELRCSRRHLRAASPPRSGSGQRRSVGSCASSAPDRCGRRGGSQRSPLGPAMRIRPICRVRSARSPAARPRRCVPSARLPGRSQTSKTPSGSWRRFLL